MTTTGHLRIHDNRFEGADEPLDLNPPELNHPEAISGWGRLSITKEVEFDAGHRVPTHGGKCRSPHGHRYRVQIECSGDLVSDESADVEAGMLTDFGFLKDLLMAQVHDPLDHGMIVWEFDPMLRAALRPPGLVDEAPWKVIVFPLIPTAENIARWVAFRLDNLIAARRGGLQLERVTVWETPTSTATWQRR